MSQRVNLPPGCGGFRCADGSVYSAKPGTSVTLEDRHAKALSSSQHQSIGLVKAGESFALGTKRGQYCEDCHRMWQAWSQVCPRCGNECYEVLPYTVLELDESSASNESTPSISAAA
jgi:hypothetical protein